MMPTPAASSGSPQTSPLPPRFRGRALASEPGQTFPKTVSQDERELNFDALSVSGSAVSSEPGSRPKSGYNSPVFGLDSPPGTPAFPRPPSRTASGELRTSPPPAPVPPALDAGALEPAPGCSPPASPQGSGQGPEGLPPQTAMGQRMDELRAHVDEVIIFCGNTRQEHQLLVAELLGLRNKLVQMDNQQRHQQRTVEALERLQGEQKNLIALLQQAVHKTRAQLEASDKQNAFLKNNLAAVQQRTQTLQENYAALTDHLVKSMDDRFEMLGPLPPDHVRIDTLNGPFPLHQQTEVKLRPYVEFFSANSDDGHRAGKTRVHVNITKEVLANLAAWANGLYIGEEVLGHGALWSLYCYGRTQGSQRLQDDFGKELHSAGVEASVRVLNTYAKERRHYVSSYVSKMVDAIAQVIRTDTTPKDSNKVTVRVPLGLSLEPGLKSQPLYNDADTMPEWRADVARAFLAATEYCKKFHVSCADDPQLNVHEASKTVTLLIECRLPY